MEGVSPAAPTGHNMSVCRVNVSPTDIKIVVQWQIPEVRRLHRTPVYRRRAADALVKLTFSGQSPRLLDALISCFQAYFLLAACAARRR